MNPRAGWIYRSPEGAFLLVVDVKHWMFGPYFTTIDLESGVEQMYVDEELDAYMRIA